MVTISINIGSDEKSINTSSFTSLHSQEVLPSPLSQNSIDGINANIPSPEMASNILTANLDSSSFPHPEDFEAAMSQSINQIPSPIANPVQNAPMDSKIPEPMDSVEFGSKSPTPKPKSRTTKRKSGPSS